MEYGNAIPEFGKALDEAVVKKALRSLTPGLHFDMGGALDIRHPRIEEWQGVYYEGRHLTAMDRGIIPEFKIWSVVETLVDAEWSEADQENVSIAFNVVPPTAEGYEDLRARAGRDNALQVREDGALVRLQPKKWIKCRGRVMKVGWRHTLERLLAANLPGLTRSALSCALDIDMHRYPQGAPEEVWAALHAV